ncbi:hypothetical protein EGW08_007814, partial [Elysia chlorotica]
VRKCIPADQYNRLRRQWRELWRRHQDFRSILFSVPSEMSKAGISFSGMRATKNLAMDSSEEQHQADLRILRVRLEALNSAQTQQLEQLSGLDPAPTFDPRKLERGDLAGPELTPREKHDAEKGPAGDGADGTEMSLADLS